MADMEMMAAFFCVDSSISYCVLPLVFVQGNNHAADDINSCEYTVNAAGHINLCCLDLRIFTVCTPHPWRIWPACSHIIRIKSEGK